MSLIRAAEKFDFARGNKFSTYASWAIMKNFARTIPDEHKHRDRFRTSHSEMFHSTEEHRSGPVRARKRLSQRPGSRPAGILGQLDEREQKIIISRFGLDHGHEPLTLKEVGVEMGVTKERIRQIEARALEKLRIAAQEEKIRDSRAELIRPPARRQILFFRTRQPSIRGTAGFLLAPQPGDRIRRASAAPRPGRWIAARGIAARSRGNQGDALDRHWLRFWRIPPLGVCKLHEARRLRVFWPISIGKLGRRSFTLACFDAILALFPCSGRFAGLARR